MNTHSLSNQKFRSDIKALMQAKNRINCDLVAWLKNRYPSRTEIIQEVANELGQKA